MELANCERQPLYEPPVSLVRDSAKRPSPEVNLERAASAGFSAASSPLGTVERLWANAKPPLLLAIRPVLAAVRVSLL